MGVIKKKKAQECKKGVKRQDTELVEGRNGCVGEHDGQPKSCGAFRAVKAISSVCAHARFLRRRSTGRRRRQTARGGSGRAFAP